MTTGAYERFGLTSNPFRDLASENLEDIELYHVSLHFDEALRTIKEEVLEKENRALIALVGPLGSGKTQRLRLAAVEAAERKAFSVYFDVPSKASWVLKGLAKEFQAAATRSGLSKTFGAPAWYRAVAGLESTKETAYDPIRAGKVLGQALNENVPAFLLLNDLHNLTQVTEASAFAKTLQEIADTAKPGVLVMFGCYPTYMAALAKGHPALASRINRTFPLPMMSNEEAGLLLAKKLLAKRLVEDVDPLYPFDRESVAALNALAQGNPRRILELADVALEYAAEHRSYRVDPALVKMVIEPRVAADSSAHAAAATPAVTTAPSAAPPAPVPAPARAPTRAPAAPSQPQRAAGTLSRLLGRSEEERPPADP